VNNQLSRDALKDALDGLAAYDHGALDSGIHDESLRARVKQQILAMPDKQRLLSEIARELFMTDEAIAQGYGLVDVVEFAQWLDNDMGLL